MLPMKARGTYRKHVTKPFLQVAAPDCTKNVADIDATVLMTTAMLGRMFATGAYYICLQCASEVFPTVIRGKGVATCEIMGGIGLFVCPMIVYLVHL